MSDGNNRIVKSCELNLDQFGSVGYNNMDLDPLGSLGTSK